MTIHSPELVPTTDREANLVSRRHGFENISELAASLSEHANVLEVGSGASPFGKEVAAIRPDVTWTNFDYSYHNPDLLEEVSRDAPSNIRYVAGDATKLGEIYGAESFDAVFSYWMMPHLSIDSREPAAKAAEAMFSLARVGGLVSIGPVVNEGHFPSIRSFLYQSKSHRIVKGEATDLGNLVDTVVTKTTLPRFARFVQKTANEVVTPLLGTTRWTTYENNDIRVYSRASGGYVPLFSKDAARTVKEVAVAGTRHVVEHHKPAIYKTSVALGALAASLAAIRYISKKR